MGGTVTVTDGKVTAAAVLPVAMRGRLAVVAVLAGLVVVGLGFRYAGDAGPGRTDARIGAAAYGVGEPWWDIANATDFLGDPGGALLLLTAGVGACLRPMAPRRRAAPRRPRAHRRRDAPAQAPRRPHHQRRRQPGLPERPHRLPHGVRPHLGAARGRKVRAGPDVRHRPRPGRRLRRRALMGWAQVATGAHYPTDTVGGCCTALAVVAGGGVGHRPGGRLPRHRLS
ncbi:hypothetical protein ACFQV4_14595 [Streptomyces thermocarboxydus]